MILTNDMLNQGMSIRNGLSARQLRILGLPEYCFDKKSGYALTGWKKKLIGKEITQEQYEEFLALKDAHLKNKKRFIPYWQKNRNENTARALLNFDGNHIQSLFREAQKNSDNPY